MKRFILNALRTMKNLAGDATSASQDARLTRKQYARGVRLRSKTSPSPSSSLCITYYMNKFVSYINVNFHFSEFLASGVRLPVTGSRTFFVANSSDSLGSS